MKRGRAADVPSRTEPNGDEASRHLPRELAAAGEARSTRRIAAEDGEWVVWIAGRGVGGTGTYNLALLEAIHFARAEQPGEAVREVLVGRGTYERLGDEELAELLPQARLIGESRA